MSDKTPAKKASPQDIAKFRAALDAAYERTVKKIDEVCAGGSWASKPRASKR